MTPNEAAVKRTYTEVSKRDVTVRWSIELKLSQLLERGGIYGINDALQNWSCPIIIIIIIIIIIWLIFELYSMSMKRAINLGLGSINALSDNWRSDNIVVECLKSKRLNYWIIAGIWGKDI